MILPARQPPSAVTSTVACASSMRSLSDMRGKPAEHHRMDGADARAGVHRDNRFGGQRHVDDHAIARLHSQRAQRVGEPADIGMQLAIGHVAHVAGLADEGERRLVTPLLEVHVEAVPGNVQLAVHEPAVVRGPGIVERDAERLVPAQLVLRLAGPETLVVGGRFAAHGSNIGRFQAGPGGKVGGRGKASFFDENGFDVLVAHKTRSVNRNAFRTVSMEERESREKTHAPENLAGPACARRRQPPWPRTTTANCAPIAPPASTPRVSRK